jgi:protoheme IX farnesyltransferase
MSDRAPLPADRPAVAGGPAPDAAAARARWLPYAELTKPSLTSLVLITTGLGFLLGSPGPVDWIGLVVAVVGTALVGGGANGLNQWWETDRDARMARTRGRPFPAGRISVRGGVAFSVALTAVGIALLAWRANPLTAGLAFASWAVYLFAYTPLKPRTTLNTLVGAVSGAIPPMLGWTAAAGRLEPGAWVLFAILFVWQIPHFLAIAWLYRADYEAGGFRMLPVVDPEGRATFRVAVFYCVGLLPVTWSASLVGISGWIYLFGATVLGAGMLRHGLRLYREGTAEAARGLFLTSIAYLPTLFLVMLLDPTRLPFRP